MASANAINLSFTGWDVLPADDIGIRTAICRADGLANLPYKKAVEQIRQVWTPYHTIASWYLWRSINPIPD